MKIVSFLALYLIFSFSELVPCVYNTLRIGPLCLNDKFRCVKIYDISRNDFWYHVGLRRGDLILKVYDENGVILDYDSLTSLLFLQSVPENVNLEFRRKEKEEYRLSFKLGLEMIHKLNKISCSKEINKNQTKIMNLSLLRIK
ncbi:hypothetical protein CH371_20030 [Leptospira wolffii]|uniref:Uncharacterized protein n=1 Tax=Leptospira wolffii TaxID=409998 RepID=A0A2M9Z6N5_9LEPT|nr:hypothetical protein CH371_20030 [Leptospira wolffii]